MGDGSAGVGVDEGANLENIGPPVHNVQRLACVGAEEAIFEQITDILACFTVTW